LEVTFKIAEMVLFTLLKNAAKGERGGVLRREDAVYLANQRNGRALEGGFWLLACR